MINGIYHGCSRAMTRPADQVRNVSNPQWVEVGRVRRFSKYHGSSQELVIAHGSVGSGRVGSGRVGSP